MTRFLLAALLVLPALGGCILPEADGLAASSIPRGFGPVFENATVEVDRTVDNCPDCDYGNHDLVDVTAQRMGPAIQVLVQAERLIKDSYLVIAVQPISEGAMPWHGHINTTAVRVNVTLDLPLITGSAIVSTGSLRNGSGAVWFQSQERIDVDEDGGVLVRDDYESDSSFVGDTGRSQGSRFSAGTEVSDEISVSFSGDMLFAWVLYPRIESRDTIPTIEVVRGTAYVQESTVSRLRAPVFEVRTIDIPLTLLVTFEPGDRPAQCAMATVDSEGFETIVKAKSTPCR